jgi:hypothetical protein
MSTKNDFSFQKWQAKRDFALLLQGGGILGIVGSIGLLLLSFQKGEVFVGWLEHHGPSDLAFSILSLAFGTFLARSARDELRP